MSQPIEWVGVMRELSQAGLNCQQIADLLNKEAGVFMSRAAVWYHLGKVGKKAECRVVRKTAEQIEQDY